MRRDGNRIVNERKAEDVVTAALRPHQHLEPDGNGIDILDPPALRVVTHTFQKFIRLAHGSDDIACDVNRQEQKTAGRIVIDKSEGIM